MRILNRPRLLAGAALALVLVGALHHLGSARADDRAVGRVDELEPAGEHASKKLTTSEDTEPRTMEELLNWEKVFERSDLPTPRVGYAWIPAGEAAASACSGESGPLGDSAAVYCPGDDTIYISQKFAADIYDGSLDHALPGSSQGYGRTLGDFAVAYIVAHEYGHQVQDELGLFDAYGGLPTMAFELQADCFAGSWAHSAYEENRLDEGDVQEEIDAALAVGDFDASNPGHHGTPEQRAEAWNAGFESGDPSSCDRYLA
jgi:uncharacterized protein